MEKIKNIIASDIQPYLESHGGSIEVLRLDPEGNLFVRLKGACNNCPASQTTLDSLVSTVLMVKMPEINHVLVEEQTVSRELLDITLDILRGGQDGMLRADKD